VPIVEAPVYVPRVGMGEEEGDEKDEEEDEDEDVEIEIGLKIALVVFEEKRQKSSVQTSSVQTRMRVLIETTGTLGHYKCLVAKLCGMAERVVAGLLEGDEDMVRACEEVKRNKGKKASADVGKRPVWDVEACGEWC